MGARKHVGWALGLLCAMALPASAHAGTWLPPAFDLSSNGFDASEVHVAMDASGDTLTVWVRNGVVQSSFRAAGGSNTFSGPTDMPAASTVASHLRVAMDANGDAVAVWQTDGGLIQAAFMPSGNGGSFNNAQTLETDGTNKPTAPDVGFDSAGDALAVWLHSDGTHIRVEDEYGPGGSFPGGPGTPISDTAQDSSSPLVRMDSAGDAVAIWLESDGAHIQVQAAARAAGNATTFGAQAQISTATSDAADPALAMSSGGAATAVWDDATNSLFGAYSGSAGSAFGSPQTVENTATSPPRASVAMNDNGDAQAVWQQSDGTNLRIEERSAPGGTFAGTTVNVSPTGEDATAPQLAMDGAGDAVAAWTDPGAQQINAAQHVSGQEFADSDGVTHLGGRWRRHRSVGGDRRRRRRHRRLAALERHERHRPGERLRRGTADPEPPRPHGAVRRPRGDAVRAGRRRVVTDDDRRGTSATGRTGRAPMSPTRTQPRLTHSHRDGERRRRSVGAEQRRVHRRHAADGESRQPVRARLAERLSEWRDRVRHLPSVHDEFRVPARSQPGRPQRVLREPVRWCLGVLP